MERKIKIKNSSIESSRYKSNLGVFFYSLTQLDFKLRNLVDKGYQLDFASKGWNLTLRCLLLLLFHGHTKNCISHSLFLSSQEVSCQVRWLPRTTMGTVVFQDLLKMANLFMKFGHCSRRNADQNLIFFTKAELPRNLIFCICKMHV